VVLFLKQQQFLLEQKGKTCSASTTAGLFEQKIQNRGSVSIFVSINMEQALRFSSNISWN